MDRQIQRKTQAALRLFEDSFFFAYPPLTYACIGLFSALCMMLAFEGGNMIPLMYADSFFGAGSSDPVFSGDGLQGGAQIVKDNIDGVGIVEEGSLIETIIFIIRYVLIFSGILALFAFIWAGFLYITTFVSEENHETAKKVMLYAAIGLLLIIFSWVIVDFLTTFDLE